MALSSADMEQWMKIRYKVKTAVACYPKEIICAPKALLKREMPNLVHYVDMPAGGHFAAFEEPVLFSNDLREAVKKFVA